MQVRVQRVYGETAPSPNPGSSTPADWRREARVLVDRLWPRGIAKVSLPLDGWCKDVAPSTELRRWYGHRPEVYDEFQARYLDELDDPERARALESLRELGRERPLTLLTATRDIEHSHAHVLAELLFGPTPI